MADRKISDLTALTTPAAGDYLPIVDVSEASASNKNKRITIEELLRGAPNGTAAAPSIAFESDPNTGIYSPGADAFGVVTGGTECARMDSSGRLLVGTSTSVLNGSTVAGKIQVADTASAAVVSVATWVNNANGSILALGKSRSATPGSYSIVSGNDLIGAVRFAADDGTDLDTRAAEIKAEVDGTPGANDMPGRLVFSTTADGASSPTERMRITSAGVLQVADAGNITVGTTTGTKIGTATTQKLGFYNATPVVQPTAVADATDAASVITQLNALLSRLRTLGIIAT